MKELTIEQKARAYDKSLERAKKLQKTCDSQAVVGWCKYIFPELKESEDEKIKKRIIQAIKIREKEMNEEWSDEIAWIEKQGNNLVENGYTNNKDVIEYAGNYSRTIWRKLMDNFKNIKDYHIGCNDVSDIVLNAIINTYNWLEKQCTPARLSEEEQNRFAKGVLTSYALSFINYLDAHKYEGKMCVSNGECEDIENAFYNTMWDKLHRYYCKYIEKQEEQKPINKVEPKFKVGDWIVYREGIWKIGNIALENYYELLKTNNEVTTRSIKEVDENARLWTIQDAKDGDVLADDYGIYIFDRFDEHDERCFLCMGAYQYSQKVFKNEHMLCSVEVYPATKEQRDLLFQKMHEAGYTFDFKKKEVKKIKVQSW